VPGMPVPGENLFSRNVVGSISNGQLLEPVMPLVETETGPDVAPAGTVVVS
jgi:hypothetical protein